MYYKDCLCDKIPAMLSFAFHDACVNHGRGGKTDKGTPIGAGMLLQDLLINKYKKNITFDGIVGAKSIEALNEVLQTNSSEKLTKEFNDRRELYFKRIVENNPSQQVFINGWLNRLKKVRTMCEGRVV
jgi:lysozyme family protein